MVDSMHTNISVWECSCGWITRHQLIYCCECGKRLINKTLEESKYYSLSKSHWDITQWSWSSIKYDPDTGVRISS
jgi:hypothetical protein